MVKDMSLCLENDSVVDVVLERGDVVTSVAQADQIVVIAALVPVLTERARANCADKVKRGERLKRIVWELGCARCSACLGERGDGEPESL